MSDDLTDELGINIPLYELIQTLRVELGASMAEAQDRRLRFALDTVDVELEVSLRAIKEAGGGVRLGVVTVKGGAKDDQSIRAKFKLSLTPSLVAGPGQPAPQSGPIEVSGTEAGPLPGGQQSRIG